MSERVKVSVVVPVYCTEQYIEECLMSLVQQTLNEIEIICVNDGTTDNSVSVIKKIKKTDPRIILYNKTNGGLSSARNYGIKKASGKYIYFLDSDDALEHTALEKLFTLAEKNKTDFITFNGHTVFGTEDDEKNFSEFVSYYERQSESTGVISGQQLYSYFSSLNEFRCNLGLFFFNRKFLESNKIQFIDGIIHEDNPFARKVCAVSSSCMYVREDFFCRRIHGGSIITGKLNFRNPYGYFIGILDTLKLLDEVKVCDVFRKNVLEEITKTRNRIIMQLEETGLEDRYTCFIPGSRDDNLFELMIVCPFCKTVEYKERINHLADDRERYKLRNEELKKSWRYRSGSVIMFIPSLLKKMLLRK